MALRIFVLLGGFFPGPDGWFDSAGMHVLRGELNHHFPQAEISEFEWDHFEQVADAIKIADPNDIIVVIGYSGGGSRATWMAQKHRHLKVNLMVLYDPSPTWQMVPIKGTGVVKCICYHNKHPFFMGLGGGEVIGDPGQVETIDVSENHMVVQTDQSLHDRTIKSISTLVQ